MTQGTTKRLPTIGTVIRAWRIYHGFSSTELAEKAGVRLGYLSEIEHDRTLRPYEDYLEKLADALHVPLGDILGRRMPPKKRDRKMLKRATGPTSDTSIPSIAHPVIDTQNVLLGTTGKEIERLLGSARLSEDEEKQIAVEVIEFTKRLLALNEALRALRKSEESRQ
jgi:transcriptional regulator with XRE-family HTH domain